MEEASEQKIGWTDLVPGSDQFNACAEPEVDGLVGKIIAEHYEIISELGRGGMSIVYKARHILLDDLRAIKFLSQDLTRSTNASVRFNREARASSRLNHSNIVRTFEYGVERELNQPFLVMEYITGKTLAEIIESQGRLSLNQFHRIFMPICDALSHAHQQGVIHRDIKPSNIMVSTKFDGTDAVKVLDFGIAKIFSEEDQASISDLTRTGEMIGSPCYMSPEQISAKQVDARSDLYSLGCTMYEALIGVPPLVGSSTIDTLMKHLHEAPLPINHCMVDDFPLQLQSIIAHMLEKNPLDRFQSTNELIKALNEETLPATNSVKLHSEPSGKGNLKLFGFLAAGIVALSLSCYFYATSMTQHPHIQSAVKIDTQAEYAQQEARRAIESMESADRAFAKWV